MANPTIFVDPPRRNPRKGGIKAVVGGFAPAPRLASASGIEWLSEGCSFPNTDITLCYVNPGVQADKTLEGLDVETGLIFGAYVGVQCFLGADTDYDRRATDLLAQGEDRVVEDHLWDWAVTNGGTTPVTGGWTAAIALLEEQADGNYLGEPVIIMSRASAVRAASAGVLKGPDEDTGRLWTANGTPVIATSSAADHEAAIIGWPTVYAGEVNVARGMRLELNSELAIAERLYGLAVDCGYALHVSVPEQAPPGEEPQETPLTLQLGSQPASPIPDGTDTTLTVMANRPPTDEVFIQYSINGGPWQTTPELTQVTPTQYVHNVAGGETGPGDSVELYATSGDAESNHIVIEVT
jgi:hypothetical protein